MPPFSATFIEFWLKFTLTQILLRFPRLISFCSLQWSCQRKTGCPWQPGDEWMFMNTRWCCRKICLELIWNYLELIGQVWFLDKQIWLLLNLCCLYTHYFLKHPPHSIYSECLHTHTHPVLSVPIYFHMVLSPLGMLWRHTCTQIYTHHWN